MSLKKIDVEKAFLSKSRIEISQFLNDMKNLIAEVPSEQRKAVFSDEIIQFNSMKGMFIGGNRILYKQIINLLEAT